MIAGSTGVHLVLDGSFLSGDTAIMVPKTADGRVMFAIPWLGRTVVGTTDVPVEHRGFDVGDEFLLGYGMDWKGRYRNVPSIWAVMDLSVLTVDPDAFAADVRSRMQQALADARALLATQQNIGEAERERLFGYLEGGGRVILPEPQPLLTRASKVPGLDGQKMSKSYDNAIPLNMPLDERRDRQGPPYGVHVLDYHYWNLRISPTTLPRTRTLPRLSSTMSS